MSAHDLLAPEVPEECCHDGAENGICIDCGAEVDWTSVFGEGE